MDYRTKRTCKELRIWIGAKAVIRNSNTTGREKKFFENYDSFYFLYWFDEVRFIFWPVFVHRLASRHLRSVNDKGEKKRKSRWGWWNIVFRLSFSIGLISWGRRHAKHVVPSIYRADIFPPVAWIFRQPLVQPCAVFHQMFGLPKNKKSWARISFHFTATCFLSNRMFEIELTSYIDLL